MNLLDELEKHPFVLAPMAGITDNSFRAFMKEMGCGIVITELVSAHGIRHHSRHTLRLMKFNADQSPVGIQLFGETPEALGDGARYVEELGADFVDLNCGCPVQKVVKKGAGSALLKDLLQLELILKTMVKAVKIPVTLKIRTGWDEGTRNAIETCKVAQNSGVTWVSIHGRTRAQGYSGVADWNYISEVRAKSNIPIIGNGDLVTAVQANSKLNSSGCHGVMIGRGCLKNPWIFKESLSIYSGSNSNTGERNFFRAFERLRFHLERDYDEKVTFLQLKKFAAWFSSGYPGASKFRKDLFSCPSIEALTPLISEYFHEIRTVGQVDTSKEHFLMGGHG